MTESEKLPVVSNPRKSGGISSPVLKVYLEGLYDENCNLSKLRGCPHLVTRIWTEVKNFWKSKIILPSTLNNKLGGNEERFGYSIQKPVVNFEEKSFKSELFLAPLCQFELCKDSYRVLELWHKVRKFVIEL